MSGDNVSLYHTAPPHKQNTRERLSLVISPDFLWQETTCQCSLVTVFLEGVFKGYIRNQATSRYAIFIQIAHNCRSASSTCSCQSKVWQDPSPISSALSSTEIRYQKCPFCCFKSRLPSFSHDSMSKRKLSIRFALKRCLQITNVLSQQNLLPVVIAKASRIVREL